MDALSIRAAAADVGDRPFLFTKDRVLSFADAAREAIVPTGPFVADASIASILTVLGALEAGVPIVPLHPRWTPAEREVAVQLVGPASDLAATLFTSGTGSAPKAVELERRCFLASARAHATNLPFKPEDRWLLALPMAHIGGLSIVTRALISRTAVVLAPGASGSDLGDALAMHRPTLLSVVPAQLERLLTADLTSVRAILVGGAAFSPSLRARAAHLPVLATYGMTETCSQIATQSLVHPPGSLDSGRPLTGAEIEVREGHIHVRGAMVMRGYRNQPLDPGGWFDTKDQGHFDDAGRLVVLGRADDTIITGGENVHPSEIEAVLLGCQGVREAVAFGVPDDVWGQIVAVALVLEDSAKAPRVLAEASEQLAAFKRPRRYVTVQEVPKQPSGKVSRAKLHIALGASLVDYSSSPPGAVQPT